MTATKLLSNRKSFWRLNVPKIMPAHAKKLRTFKMQFWGFEKTNIWVYFICLFVWYKRPGKIWRRHQLQSDFTNNMIFGRIVFLFLVFGGKGTRPAPRDTAPDPFRFRVEDSETDDPFRFRQQGEEAGPFSLTRSKRQAGDGLGYSFLDTNDDNDNDDDEDDCPCRDFRSATSMRGGSSLAVSHWEANGYTLATCSRIVQIVECTDSELLVS